ncbi:alkane 1-monooxygenase [Thalassobius sp. Cn5-15]|uniref:alkane 1-monooxygenase n=1 Tax=Thalassobius sp. Cn5-15 TaxID=2917763 RepID=UPI001EF1F33A|nr:alkane 1-monooxygenase [Thalassobius sp. Cn5-15]MCG7494087.1 alkane 1-monooxygenase [Thalassobius sp. Cn5-15]
MTDRPENPPVADATPKRLSLIGALPFWLSLTLIPIALIAATQGGYYTLLLPLWAWWLFTFLDFVTGLNLDNADPNTPDEALLWYRMITWIWFPLQAAVIFGMIYYATRAGHLGVVEKLVLFFGIGVISGTVGINYSHELMHQKNKWERWLGDLLLSTVLYSHFRSEHLLVHHRHVGTPADAVTARYNEGFHRFFFRVLPECWISAFRAEKALLARGKRPVWSRRNPFWRYAVLQVVTVSLAVALGGVEGLALFAVQAFSAIWQLELTNYVEHYGLTRKHLGGGKYEHVKPRHSWNAAHKATNWLLINLQRHSDHHYKPDRRFPLLQNYDAEEAPQFPYGYPIMTVLAMIPPLWRRRMNPRVRDWRRKFYPEVEDWTPYKLGSLPKPRL